MIQIPMTPAQFDAKKAELEKDYNVTIESDSGEVQHSTATIDYHYDGSVLTLTVIHKPFFISLAAAETELRNWFAPVE